MRLCPLSRKSQASTRQRLQAEARQGGRPFKVVVLEAGDRFWTIFQEQMVEARVSGPLVTDRVLASLALEHGATLCSTDRDFRGFRGLKIRAPENGLDIPQQCGRNTDRRDYCQQHNQRQDTGEPEQHPGHVLRVEIVRIRIREVRT
jgi:hypothetical protein